MRRRTNRLLTVSALSLAVLTVSGCEIQRANEASDAQSRMVGMTKEQILGCMGPPANTALVGTTEVWTYNSGNGRTDTAGTASAWGNYGWASGFGFSTTEARFCKVNVVMNFSRVSRINYTGPTGGLLTKGEQCAYAIENCAGSGNLSAALAVPTQAPAAVDTATPTQGLPSPGYTTNAGADAPSSGDTAPPRHCTKEDLEMARRAEAEGYQFHASCI